MDWVQQATPRDDTLEALLHCLAVLHLRCRLVEFVNLGPEAARLGSLPDRTVLRSTAARHYTLSDWHQAAQKRARDFANAMSKAHEWCADAYGACEGKTGFKADAPVSERNRILTPQLYQHSTPMRYRHCKR